MSGSLRHLTMERPSRRTRCPEPHKSLRALGSQRSRTGPHRGRAVPQSGSAVPIAHNGRTMVRKSRQPTVTRSQPTQEERLNKGPLSVELTEHRRTEVWKVSGERITTLGSSISLTNSLSSPLSAVFPWNCSRVPSPLQAGEDQPSRSRMRSLPVCPLQTCIKGYGEGGWCDHDRRRTNAETNQE